MQQVNYKKFNPVITISTRSKILVGIVRFFYRSRQWLSKNETQLFLPNHHEDPSAMTSAELLYMGNKYYFSAMTMAEPGSGLETYFANQTLLPAIPANFIPAQTITLSAGGDLMPYSSIQPEVCTNLWKNTGKFFFNADIVFANLESPADFSKPCSAAPEVMLHDMYFNANAAMLKIFSGNGQFKGYDVLSVANNHSLDMGVDGLTNTLQLLQQKGIAYTGAALTEEAQNDFPIIDKKGIKVAFLSATFSFNKEVLPADKPWLCNHILLNLPNPDISLLVKQAAIARQRGADIIVAALHMGCAYQAYPGLHTVNNIHHICDKAGIDVIIAGHPHQAQPMEIYNAAATGKQHFIVYSLGDFIAYDIFKWGHLPMMLHLQISKGMLNGKPFTCVTDIKIKAAYMHATVKGGKIKTLELLDYLELKKNAATYFTNKKDLQKFNEISQFFEQFVLQPHQQHVLV